MDLYLSNQNILDIQRIQQLDERLAVECEYQDGSEEKNIHAEIKKG